MSKYSSNTPPRDPAPLRDIPFSIVVDGVEVQGLITCLFVNDITVEITSPVAGLSSGVHIPYFAMGVHAVSTGTAITQYGRKKAEWLLSVIYDYSRGLDPGWGVDEVKTGERLPRIGGTP